VRWMMRIGRQRGQRDVTSGYRSSNS
jgi:hypothetical protein